MKRRILLDTNVLLRYAGPDDPFHSKVRDAMDRHMASGDELCITPQVLREIWVVATRPAEVNGLGRSEGEAETLIRLFLGAFTLLDDRPGIFAEWLDLVTTHNVKGRQAHDANLAAAARHHGLTHVLTLNVGDFRRYALAGLAVLTP